MRKNLELEVVKPQNVTTENWISSQLAKIVEASREDAAIDAAEAFNGIDHSTYTKLETFAPNTATTAEVARVLATLIQYLQNHGPRKS